MNIGYYLKSLLSSCNPNSYKNLVGRSLKDSFNFFFVAIILGLILFVILFVPYMVTLSNTLGNTFNQLDTFTLDADVSHAEPIVLSNTPKVVLDLNKTNFTNADVLITRNHVYYKPYVWFGEASINLNEIANLKAHQDRAQSLLVTIMIFLLPAILVLLFVAFTVKNLAIALIATFIGFIIFKLTHYNVKFTSLFKTALYATGIVVILDVILLLFYPLLWIPLIVYFLLFLLGSWSIAKKRFSIRQRKQHEFPDKK